MEKNKNKNKQTYKSPEIEHVVVDSEISLNLNSTPPYPLNERTEIIHKDYFDNKPYKMA